MDIITAHHLENQKHENLESIEVIQKCIELGEIKLAELELKNLRQRIERIG